MSQSLSNILVHIVFSTKNREPTILPSIENELYAFLISQATDLGNYVHKIGGIHDHLHMLVTLRKTLSISEIIEELKKSSSRWIKTKGQAFDTFAWQKGYGAFSASATHPSSSKKQCAV
jgi:putative transposase